MKVINETGGDEAAATELIKQLIIDSSINKNEYTEFNGQKVDINKKMKFIIDSIITYILSCQSVLFYLQAAL